MEFQFGSFHLDVDRDKTSAFYKERQGVGRRNRCGCPGCRNFEKAADALPHEIRRFFDVPGVDIRKPAEVYVNAARPDGLLLYGGFYHLCGRLLSGESAWVLNGSDANGRMPSYHWDSSKAYLLAKAFHVSFQEDCGLVEEGFPSPVLQLEIAAALPWMLAEENPYSVATHGLACAEGMRSKKR